MNVQLFKKSYHEIDAKNDINNNAFGYENKHLNTIYLSKMNLKAMRNDYCYEMKINHTTFLSTILKDLCRINESLKKVMHFLFLQEFFTML